MLKRLTIMAAAIVLSFGITSCSDDSGTSSTTTGDTGSTETADTDSTETADTDSTETADTDSTETADTDSTETADTDSTETADTDSTETTDNGTGTETTDNGTGTDEGPPKCEEVADCDAVCPDGFTCECVEFDGEKVCALPCEKDDDCPEIEGNQFTCNTDIGYCDPGDGGGGPGDDGPPDCDETVDCESVCPPDLTCECMDVGLDSSKCVIACEKDEDCPEINGDKLTCTPGGFCSPGGPPPDGGGGS